MAMEVNGGGGACEPGALGAQAGTPAVAAIARWVRYGGRPLEIELRARGRGAGAPLALIGESIELELTPADLEWICAVAPRVLAKAREVL